MRKWALLFVVLMIVIASIAGAALWNADFGYILLISGDWQYQQSLSRALFLLIPGLILFYVAVRMLLKLWRSPKLLREYRRRRSAESARRNVIQGLIGLVEGHWQDAERILLRNIDNSDTPLLNYLMAARAAQQQDADDRRDQYLKRAHEVTPEADTAIGLTQAELQLAHGQTEQALATLTRLRELAPKHPYVLKLLSRLYVQLGEWEKLAALLPEIRKRRIVTGDKLLELEHNTYTQFIYYVARTGDVFNLEEQWKLLPRRYREDSRIFRVYIECLINSDNVAAAEKQLRLFLNKHWDEMLVQLYGRMDLPHATSKYLDYAEAWLKDHGRSPMLLLTLGRLCQHLRLWGKSRVYYESSIAVHPTVEAYAELGELLESLGEVDSSKECYRKGLALSRSQSRSRRMSDQPKLAPLPPVPSPPAATPRQNMSKGTPGKNIPA